jgi:hypothetical protein
MPQSTNGAATTSKRRWQCFVAASAAALALAGCASPWEGTQLDEWGWYACDDFAEQVSKAGGAQVAYELGPLQRASFASAVAESAGRSTTAEIKDGAVVLTRTTQGAQASWKLGMDTFASRCLDRGWK